MLAACNSIILRLGSEKRRHETTYTTVFCWLTDLLGKPWAAPGIHFAALGRLFGCTWRLLGGSRTLLGRLAALQSSRAAQNASTSFNPGLGNMMQLMPPNGGGGGMIPTVQLPSEEAAGTAGVAMASAQMLMIQATAAAQVIASLAATVRELEGPHKENDPASPSH